jgi:hypothetical protein
MDSTAIIITSVWMRLTLANKPTTENNIQYQHNKVNTIVLRWSLTLPADKMFQVTTKTEPDTVRFKTWNETF